MEPSYISGKVYSELWHNGTFLYFGKGLFRALAYLELEAYSEPWYIQDPTHIQDNAKHLPCDVLQK